MAEPQPSGPTTGRKQTVPAGVFCNASKLNPAGMVTKAPQPGERLPMAFHLADHNRKTRRTGRRNHGSSISEKFAT